MRCSKNQPVTVPTTTQACQPCDVLCGLLVLLMLLVPAVLVGIWLHRLSVGAIGVSSTSIDPMLFRMTGLG
jgi:hypothetical protein